MVLERVRVFNQGRIDAPADKVWAFLTDWAGTKRPQTGGDGDLTLSQIVLEGREDQVPRTRVMQFGALGEIRETLLYQDDATRHLYYNIEGVGPHGIKNYLATTDVDAVADGRSQVTISARFDIDDTGDLIKAKALIDFAHNQAVIEGLRAYFTEKR